MWQNRTHQKDASSHLNLIFVLFFSPCWSLPAFLCFLPQSDEMKAATCSCSFSSSSHLCSDCSWFNTLPSSTCVLLSPLCLWFLCPMDWFFYNSAFACYQLFNFLKFLSEKQILYFILSSVLQLPASFWSFFAEQSDSIKDCFTQLCWAFFPSSSVSSTFSFNDSNLA